jgi:hypothetical protein
LVVDQATKRRVIDLSSNEHHTIRDIAKNTKKSSRDIIAMEKQRKLTFMGIIYQHPKKKQGTQNMTFLQILKPTNFFPKEKAL